MVSSIWAHALCPSHCRSLLSLATTHEVSLHSLMHGGVFCSSFFTPGDPPLSAVEDGAKKTFRAITTLILPLPLEDVPDHLQAGQITLRVLSRRSVVTMVVERSLRVSSSVSVRWERENNSGFRVRRAPRARTIPRDVMCINCPCVRQPVP